MIFFCQLSSQEPFVQIQLSVSRFGAQNDQIKSILTYISHDIKVPNYWMQVFTIPVVAQW